MRHLRKEIPGLFSGKVLEIGAGTGFISSSLSTYSETVEVFALDYDKYTVEKLMPLVQWSLGAETKKMVRVIGSYNKMQAEDNTFDTIVAVGSMHHSEDVRATFNECFRVLKPGGKFIVSDYVLDNHLRQEEFNGMMDMPLNECDVQSILDGQNNTKVKTNRTISEHGRPSYTYLSAAFDAGFNINANFFDATTQSGGYLGLVCRYAKALYLSIMNKKLLVEEKESRVFGYDVFGNVKSFSLLNKVAYPFYAKNKPGFLSLLLRGQNSSKPIYDNMVLILEKPIISDEPQFKYKFKNGSAYIFPVNLT
jgi:SAM-dependent methyltransferase